MIYVSIKDLKFARELGKAFSDIGVDCKVVRPNRESYLGLYKGKVTGVVVDGAHPTLPVDAWTDLLNSLAKRIPVIVLNKSQEHTDLTHVASVFSVKVPSVDDVISTLDQAGALGRYGSSSIRQNLPVYDSRIAVHMLQKNQSLSVLVINAQEFQRIDSEYGNEPYSELSNFFEKKLISLWGAPGSFRTGDVLCKRSMSANVYYIFLEPSRSMQDIPLPGALQKLADRLTLNLQHLLWNDLFRVNGHRELPDCISNMPSFCVGHATRIANPCVKPADCLDALMEDAVTSSLVQNARIQARETELIQSLIRYEGMLMPAFQAVFHAKDLNESLVTKARDASSIAPIKHAVYGFESLIRVNQGLVNKLIDHEGPLYLEARYLVPNVLFALAAKAALSLELDQVCISIGSKYGAVLPGKLLINILPRNLYYIDQLYHLVPDDVHVIFELSESEAINNFELLLKVRDSLTEMNLGIAADDFGKGYAGLERVIKVKPDLIKLDRILIQNIDKETGKAAFVRGLVDAAKSSNSIILAEGVETMEEFLKCKELGVDLMQGFLFHRPVAIDSILEQLAENELENVVDIDRSTSAA